MKVDWLSRAVSRVGFRRCWWVCLEPIPELPEALREQIFGDWRIIDLDALADEPQMGGSVQSDIGRQPLRMDAALSRQVLCED